MGPWSPSLRMPKKELSRHLTDSIEDLKPGT